MSIDLGNCLTVSNDLDQIVAFVPLPIQARQGLPTMCLFVYFAVFGMPSSLQISIKFFIVNDSNHSTVC